MVLPSVTIALFVALPIILAALVIALFLAATLVF
jgi:hypothetical protein